MIIAGGSTMIIGTIILTSSTTIAQLLVGRVVTGIVSISLHSGAFSPHSCPDLN